MDETFFAGVKIEKIQLSTGVRIELPVRYYDWSAIMAHFPAPAAKVQELLPTDRLKPAQLVPGTAVVSMVAMDSTVVEVGYEVANKVGGIYTVLSSKAEMMCNMIIILYKRMMR